MLFCLIFVFLVGETWGSSAREHGLSVGEDHTAAASSEMAHPETESLLPEPSSRRRRSGAYADLTALCAPPAVAKPWEIRTSLTKAESGIPELTIIERSGSTKPGVLVSQIYENAFDVKPLDARVMQLYERGAVDAETICFAVILAIRSHAHSWDAVPLAFATTLPMMFHAAADDFVKAVKAYEAAERERYLAEVAISRQNATRDALRTSPIASTASVDSLTDPDEGSSSDEEEEEDGSSPVRFRRAEVALGLDFDLTAICGIDPASLVRPHATVVGYASRDPDQSKGKKDDAEEHGDEE